ncbi:MAG: START domain-containing protein [Bacteroidota bacterium]
MTRFPLFLLANLLTLSSSAQYDWKPEKEGNGIRVYLSDVKGSSFKAVKVECTFTGTYARLIAVLTNTSRFSEWIFHNKTSRLLKKNSVHDLVYYSETRMPWPLSNRDVIIRMRINTTNLPGSLSIQGNNEVDFIPEIPGRVRVPHYKANWVVTMPASSSLKISYILEIDPGGSIPPWVANSYADKGPFETFSNLAEELKK